MIQMIQKKLDHQHPLKCPKQRIKVANVSKPLTCLEAVYHRLALIWKGPTQYCDLTECRCGRSPVTIEGVGGWGQVQYGETPRAAAVASVDVIAAASTSLLLLDGLALCAVMDMFSH